MNRVIYNRWDFPYHSEVRTVILLPPNFCVACKGRIDCLVHERPPKSCMIKVEWYIPRDRREPCILVYDLTAANPLTIPYGYKPVEIKGKDLEVDFYLTTGLTLEDFKKKTSK